MKIINVRVLGAIVMLGLLGSMACKKKDTSPPDPGPDDQVLRAIHQNGVLMDSFYYNKRQQVTVYKHFNGAGAIDHSCTMTYDNAGNLIAASINSSKRLSEKNQVTTTANTISIVGNIYDSDGSLWSPYTTILKFDNSGRFVSMLDTVHSARQTPSLSNTRWITTVNRRYDSDKLISYEEERISKKYDPATPNIDTITSDITSNKRFEYGNTPNKLYSLGKKNPYLLVITGPANPLYAGSTNVTKTTMGNSTSVFQDIHFTTGFYVQTRKETTITDGVSSTTQWDFYYSPVSGL